MSGNILVDVLLHRMLNFFPAAAISTFPESSLLLQSAADWKCSAMAWRGGMMVSNVYVNLTSPWRT